MTNTYDAAEAQRTQRIFFISALGVETIPDLL
jgi:hypothetical protein